MEEFWLKRGQQVALRLNAARWLGFTAPAVTALGVASGCAILVARRNEWSLIPLAVASGLLLVLLLGIGGWQARKHWSTTADGLVRLDAVLRLRNRLSSAAQGVGSWPEAPTSPASCDDHFRWRWSRLLLAPLLGMAFLTAAMRLPISRDPDANAAAKVEAPLAWEQVGAALDELKREEAADPDALAAMEQKLETLRSQPLETWYSQGSLEAGEALRHEAANAIAALERNLEAATQSLAKHQNSTQALSASAAAAQWKDVMEGLQSGALPLGKTDLGKLRAFDPAAARQLSPEQLQQLQENLSRKADASHAALGKVSEALDRLAEGMSECESGEEGKKPSGKPGPGGGHDSLALKNTPTAINPEQEEALQGEGAERLAPGDVLSLSASEHKVDPTEVRPTAGGAASAGSGGEAVWKNELAPAEREVLRRFFK
jgi:hypothetical protein